jgi:hypothetical protein
MESATDILITVCLTLMFRLSDLQHDSTTNFSIHSTFLMGSQWEQIYLLMVFSNTKLEPLTILSPEKLAVMFGRERHLFRT